MPIVNPNHNELLLIASRVVTIAPDRNSVESNIARCGYVFDLSDIDVSYITFWALRYLAERDVENAVMRVRRQIQDLKEKDKS